MPGLDRPLVPAVVLALGLFLGGAAAGRGFARARLDESQIVKTVRVVPTIDYLLRG
jgi:hypothetical protein